MQNQKAFSIYRAHIFSIYKHNHIDCSPTPEAIVFLPFLEQSDLHLQKKYGGMGQSHRSISFPKHQRQREISVEDFQHES
jgi:hypothetical protein